MFGMSGVEIGILFVLALLLLGPQKLPELARSIGKGVRDFKKATEGIRSTVEDEFYNLDKPPAPELRTVNVQRTVAPQLQPGADTAAAAATAEAAVIGANQPPTALAEAPPQNAEATQPASAAEAKSEEAPAPPADEKR